jgi:hypothetical protein
MYLLADLVADDANKQADSCTDCMTKAQGHRLEEQETESCDGHEEVEYSLRDKKYKHLCACMYVQDKVL